MRTLVVKGLEHNIVARVWWKDRIFFKETTGDDMVECKLSELQTGRIWRVHGGRQ